MWQSSQYIPTTNTQTACKLQMHPKTILFSKQDSLRAIMLPDLFLPALTLIILTIFILRIFSNKQPHTHHDNVVNNVMPPSPRPLLPLIGHLHLLHPLLHQSFQKLSISLGPIFHLKLGSIPAIIVSSPDLAKLFLKTHELTFANRLNTKAIIHITSNSPFATAPYGPYWKFIKKLCMTEILGNKSLNRFVPLRRRETHRLIKKLKMKADRGEVVNVTEELLKMTNDIISEMMIGKKCSEADAEQVARLVRDVTRIFGEFNVADFVWVCRKIDFFNGYRKRYEEVRCSFDAILEKIIKEREEQRKEKQSIIEDDKEPECFLDTVVI